MVKHSARLMASFFTRERFGQPQVLAGILLLIFWGQCTWLVDCSLHRGPADLGEMVRIHEGLKQWRGKGIAGAPYASLEEELPGGALLQLSGQPAEGAYDSFHSPLWYLIASAPLLAWPGPTAADTVLYWGWQARLPYVMFGLLLGASLWYVARRLYGNAGGYVALALYCFSPAVLRASTLWATEPEIGAAWGSFGAIFTAIAVAHTLYAPREVVLWNWRRIGLLGLSLALAIGSQFPLIILAPLALGFMLYLAPGRRGAATAIWLASCAMALLLLLASYAFHISTFWQGMKHANFLAITWRAFALPVAYHLLLDHLAANSPALIVGVPVVVVAYLVWPRSRYFGTNAPLLVAVLFLLLAIAMPHHPGLGFVFLAAPFLFVFVAGVCADLLETPQRQVVAACIWGLLAALAIWNFWQLAGLRAT